MSTAETQANDQLNYHTIDEKKADALKDGQIDLDDLSGLESRIKLLSNDTRLRILSFLSQEDLCVHDLTALLSMSQSAVSHQLKKLWDQDLLNRRKEGRVVYYSLAEDTLEETLFQLRTIFLD